jgi:hypothetical protein
MGKEKELTKSSYSEANVEACKSVLIELINLLGEFKDSIVLVGGWVPALMYPDAKPEHIRSLDIDLAFDHRTIDEETYTSLENVLLKNDYFPEPDKTYSYYKEVNTTEGKQIKVYIDFLSGVYGGTGKGRRHQAIQNVKARKLQGAELIIC